MYVILQHVVEVVFSTEKLYIVELLHMKKKNQPATAIYYRCNYCFENVRQEKTQKHKRSHCTYLHYFVHSELIRS